MIKIKIAELAKRHGLNTAYALQKALDLPPTMAARLYKGDFDKIGIGTIEKLCEYFHCQPDAFLEYPLAPVNYTQQSNTQTGKGIACVTQSDNTELSNETQSGNTELRNESDNKTGVLTFNQVIARFKEIGKSKTDSSLRRYLKSKKLKGELVGGEWEIAESDYQDFINSDFFRNLK